MPASQFMRPGGKMQSLAAVQLPGCLETPGIVCRLVCRLRSGRGVGPCGKRGRCSTSLALKTCVPPLCEVHRGQSKCDAANCSRLLLASESHAEGCEASDEYHFAGIVDRRQRRLHEPYGARARRVIWPQPCRPHLSLSLRFRQANDALHIPVFPRFCLSVS
jgi:hypothetical protein